MKTGVRGAIGRLIYLGNLAKALDSLTVSDVERFLDLGSIVKELREIADTLDNQNDLQTS